MTADECDFEHEGYCCPPEDLRGYVCPSSILEDGMRKCNGNNNELMTEEEYDAMVAAQESPEVR